MKKYMHTSKYFYGNKISNYGLENGYIDYATLARSFDAVLNNNIMKNTTEIYVWEQINGIVDNSEKIDELIEKKESIDVVLHDMIDNGQKNTIKYKIVERKYNEIESDIQELRDAGNYSPEIFQYYIISDSGADILCKFTDEIVFYNDKLDMYVWGVCHFGTAWNYVLTDIPVNVEG